MAFLLDTNVIIWLFEDDRRLSATARNAMLRGEAPNFISVVSAWEYGQKRRIRPREFLSSFVEICAGIPHEPLDLAFAAHRFAATLPMIHRDPFDRMLIAQAIHHDLTLIASDDLIRQYPVRTLW